MIKEFNSINNYQKASRPIIFACIAALNEEISISNMIIQSKKYVDEVFVCDDGSIDSTGSISNKMGAHVIRHEVNIGKGSAIKDLFLLVSRYNPDAVVMLDADGQHNASDIPKLIEPILMRDADVVIGSRFITGAKTDVPLYRRFGLQLFNLLIKRGVGDTQSGFRAFSGKAVTIMTKCEEDGFGIETEQIFLARKYKLRIKEVPIDITYTGLIKTSTLNPINHGLQIIKTIFKYQSRDKPLIFWGIPSLILFSMCIISLILLSLRDNQSIAINISLIMSTIGCFFSSYFMGKKALRLINKRAPFDNIERNSQIL